MKGDKIHYRKGYKYQLDGDYSIQTPVTGYNIDTEYIRLTPDGMLTMRHGYAWDGASGTTFDTKSSMRGALVHDGFYDLLRQELISHNERCKVDDLLHDICEEDGMWKWRADLWFIAVRKFGITAADPEHSHPIIEAP